MDALDCQVSADLVDPTESRDDTVRPGHPATAASTRSVERERAATQAYPETRDPRASLAGPV